MDGAVTVLNWLDVVAGPLDDAVDLLVDGVVTVRN